MTYAPLITTFSDKPGWPWNQYGITQAIDGTAMKHE
jgi:hypothetical protein